MHHKYAWYNSTIQELFEVLELQLPFELVHFPSCGLFSSLQKMQALEEESGLEIIFIDLTLLELSEDQNTVRDSFKSLIHRAVRLNHKTHINSKFDESLFAPLREVIEKSISKNKRILFVFQNISNNDIYKYDILKDILIFLDNYRSKSNGLVNFFLTSNHPSFVGNNAISVPIIQKYFNYYKENEIRETIINLAKDMNIAMDNSDVDHLIQISGGLTLIYKNLLRDIKLNNIPYSSIYKYKEFHKEFFDEFNILKSRLDDFCTFVPDADIHFLKKLSKREPLNESEQKLFENYKKLGAIDEKGNLRSLVLSNFLADKTFNKKVPSEEILMPDHTKSTIQQPEKHLEPEVTKSYITVSANYKVNTDTYEIEISNQSTNSYLTENEYKILSELVKEKGKPISREDIAKIMWGDNYTIQYSDWAIDKTISRIREKIGDEKPHQIIITLKKRGFLMK